MSKVIVIMEMTSKEEDIMDRLVVNFAENQNVHHFPEGIKYRIPLKCGLQMSVIQTDFSYGGSLGLYEIAIVDPKTETLVDVSGKIDEFEDTVKGFLTEDEVRHYIKIFNKLLDGISE